MPSLPDGLLLFARGLGELKRVRSAGRAGSIASRLFAASWVRLADGAAVGAAMRADLAAALVASGLGDLDAETLGQAGLDASEAEAVVARAYEAAAGAIDPALRAQGRAGLEAPKPAGQAPAFVGALARQPRAGITDPGRPRVVLEPPENHAEHCALVAITGVLLAPAFGADPERVWLAGLAHHLHNATLPDAGFAGEALLGDALEPLFARATELALAELPAGLAERVRWARAVLPDDATPEGRAFHAADTLDRVWQIDQHLRPARLTLDAILGDTALVHEGPVRRFQGLVLREAGLLGAEAA